MIGLDSCAIIDFANGDASLKLLLDNINEPMAINQISCFEIMLGMDLDNENYKMEEDFYNNFFQSVLNLNLDIDCSKKASQIYWDLRRKGKIIDDFDCAIASIYLNSGVNKIITRNIKHFENVKGLKVISY